MSSGGHRTRHVYNLVQFPTASNERGQNISATDGKNVQNREAPPLYFKTFVIRTLVILSASLTANSLEKVDSATTYLIACPLPQLSETQETILYFKFLHKINGLIRAFGKTVQ